MLEPVSASEMTESLKEKSLEFDEEAFLYMVQHSGESDCMPHCRTPRFRTRLKKARLAARCLAGPSPCGAHSLVVPAHDERKSQGHG